MSDDNTKYEEAKIEFIVSKISLKKLAEKYKLDINKLYKLSYRENWADAREKYRQKVANKIYNRMSNAEALHFKRLLGNLDQLEVIFEKAVKDEKQAYMYEESTEDGKVFNERDRVNVDYLHQMESLVQKMIENKEHLLGVLPMDKIRKFEIDEIKAHQDASQINIDNGSAAGVIVLPDREENSGDDDD